MALRAKTYPVLVECIENGIRAGLLNEAVEEALRHREQWNTRDVIDRRFEDLVDRIVMRVTMEIDQRMVDDNTGD